MMRERGIYIVSMMHGIHTPPYSSTVDIVPHKTTRPYIPHNMSLNNEMTALTAEMHVACSVRPTYKLYQSLSLTLVRDLIDLVSVVTLLYI